MKNVNISPTLRNIILDSIYSEREFVHLTLSLATERDEDIVNVLLENLNSIELPHNAEYPKNVKEVYINFQIKLNKHIVKLIQEDA